MRILARVPKLMTDLWPEEADQKLMRSWLLTHSNPKLTLSSLQKFSEKNIVALPLPDELASARDCLQEAWTHYTVSYRVLPVVLYICCKALAFDSQEDTLTRIQKILQSLHGNRWITTSQYAACQEFFSEENLNRRFNL